MTRSWITTFTAGPASQSASAEALARRCAEPPVRLWRWLAACRRRAAERNELRCLDEHSRRDIGPKRVSDELARAFWIE